MSEQFEMRSQSVQGKDSGKDASKAKAQKKVVTKAPSKQRCGGKNGKTRGACGKLLPLSAFGFNRSMKDGRAVRCRACESKRITAYRENNPAYRAKGVEYSVRYRERYPERNLLNVVRYRYGITPEERTRLIEEQNNACARCRIQFSESAFPCMDHDHSCCSGERSCGKCIRGVLCAPCNGKLRVEWCREHQDDDSYLLRYRVKRALADGDDKALSALLKMFLELAEREQAEQDEQIEILHDSLDSLDSLDDFLEAVV